MESSVAPFTVLYCTIPVLLRFNILPFFYEHPVLFIFLLYKERDMQFHMVFSKQGSLYYLTNIKRDATETSNATHSFH